MSIRPHHIAREIGTALAVLAVYVLVLLVPLHQAAGLQRDLSQLGYESQWSWSVCTSVSGVGDPDTPTAVKCPLSSAGKVDVAILAPPGGLPFEWIGRSAGAAIPAAYAPDFLVALAGLPGRPRGPPALA